MQNIQLSGIEVLSRGTPITCLIKTEQECDAVIPVGLLMQIAPSPRGSEDPRLTAIDVRLREVAAMRKDVQRAFTGAKAKNVKSYASYIDGGLRGAWPLGLPAIHIWHPTKLDYVEFPPGSRSVVWGHGEVGVCIDGETQRASWEEVAKVNPEAMSRPVSVTIHHGKGLDEVRELFYMFNVAEVKPTASIAISMDPRDVATNIARALIEGSSLLHERVSMTGRSAKGSDIATLGAIRNAVVTTIRGTAGLQVGARRMEWNDEEEDEIAVRTAVLEIWRTIFNEFKNEFDQAREKGLVIAAPSVLAGVGAVAHHAMPAPPRDPATEAWTIDHLIDVLRKIDWRARTDAQGWEEYPWDGVGGRVNQSGRFTVSGPKEVGHQIAFAIENADSEPGRKIRKR